MAAAAASRQIWSIVGLSAVAIGLAAFAAPHAGAHPERGLAVLLFLGSSTHVASTACLFGFAEVRAHAARHPARYILIPAALVALSALAAATIPSEVFSVGLLGYFGWQLHHYQKQNLGLAALAASAYRVTPLRSAERRMIVAAGWTGIAGLCLRPSLLQLAIHLPATPWFAIGRIATTAAFCICTVAGWREFIRRNRTQRPSAFCVTYAMAVLFPLPIFVFGSPYAALAGITIAHGIQYLLLIGRVSIGPGPRRPSTTQALAVTTGVLTGGLLLSLASHLHDGAPLSRAVYGGYLGIVMAHFVVDAGLWRMRDAFPRQFLTARLPDLLSTPPVSACDISAYGVASAA